VASGATAASLVLADLDHFKGVIASYGHEAGDFILREFSERLKSRLRAVDLAARYGGEEFVILMPDAPLIEAKAGAERLRAVVADTPFRLPGEGGVLTVTVSIGVAEIHPGDDVDSVLRRADEALYRAKAEGRNCVMSDQKANQAA